ncbi:hydrophobic surface binding protein A domain-containing protein [Cordyceps javanica]|uniref:Hydrophobic surface binding protein A domain-containing protein n=1 Tax=Cordyceps javanica TaxID=43265 RepID=A0A545VT67_9HYPO|nr:hydrophobic surface binding protein A domain-containing protein [Cordyceps javanica]TQW04884.1 hydrophobic surface binding protein A domain-containing protein [Cordyceps javanica]
MHPKTLIPFLVAPALGHFLQRDEKSVIDSISSISEQLTAMNATLDKIQGADDAQAAVDFQNQATQLQSNLQTATDSAKSSAAFTGEESSNVAYSVVGITDVTYAVLGKVAVKRDVFNKLGGSAITDLVRDELQGLQNSTLGFGAALTDKFVKAVQDVAPLLISSLEFHFYQTIQVYTK